MPLVAFVTRRHWTSSCSTRDPHQWALRPETGQGSGHPKVDDLQSLEKRRISDYRATCPWELMLEPGIMSQLAGFPRWLSFFTTSGRMKTHDPSASDPGGQDAFSMICTDGD